MYGWPFTATPRREFVLALRTFGLKPRTARAHLDPEDEGALALRSAAEEEPSKRRLEALIGANTKE